MKIAIIGSGAIGGYFGGKLAQAGNDVSFLARGKHLDAMKTNGLIVKSIKGDFTIKPVKAMEEISEMERADLVILGVKAWQVAEVAPVLHHLLHENTTVLPLQNGVTATEDLLKYIEERHVIGGLCRIISKIKAPGVIDHFAFEPSIVIGEIDNSRSERINSIQQLLTHSNITASIADNIAVDLWKKFIFICVGGLLAVTRSNFGELRSKEETREMTALLLQEICDLASALGIQVGADYVPKTMSFIDDLAPEATSSLARDIWEGRPSEIDYLNGTVVKLAEKHGVEVPVNRFVYHSLMLMEERAKDSI